MTDDRQSTTVPKVSNTSALTEASGASPARCPRTGAVNITNEAAVMNWRREMPVGRASLIVSSSSTAATLPQASDAVMVVLATQAISTINSPSDHAARAVARRQRVQRIVDAAQPVGSRNELFQFEPSLLIERHEMRDVAPRLP